MRIYRRAPLASALSLSDVTALEIRDGREATSPTLKTRACADKGLSLIETVSAQRFDPLCVVARHLCCITLRPSA